MKKLASLALVLAATTLVGAPGTTLFAQTRSAAFTVVESGESFDHLQQAVDSIGDGQGTIEIAPGLHAECAVQKAGDIAYLARDTGKAVFDSKTCEGKAALVLRGRGAEVSGIVFQNMRVPDANGAGIRLEKGNLTVAQSWFRDSEQGILTANDPNGTIVIDKSTFTRLGRCDRGMSCAHSIYIGDYGLLRVTRSRFEQGRGGHYVKTRSTRVEIAASSFDDTGGKATNYMIDLPASSTGQITNNWFVQGRDKENYSAFIAVGAEGRLHTADGLLISGNNARFAPGVDRNSTFVGDWSGDRLVIGDNLLAPGIKLRDSR